MLPIGKYLRVNEVRTWEGKLYRFDGEKWVALENDLVEGSVVTRSEELPTDVSENDVTLLQEPENGEIEGGDGNWLPELEGMPPEEGAPIVKTGFIDTIVNKIVG